MKTKEDDYREVVKYSFSLDQLNKIGNNNEEFNHKMIEQFILSAVESSKNMLSALEESNWVKLKSAAHKGIPSYAIMDLSELVKFMKKIELNAESDSERENVKELVKLFDQENQAVINEMGTYLKQS